MKTIEILNYEGPVLKVSLNVSGKAIVKDQWNIPVASLSKEKLQEFLKGEFQITDSEFREWNYLEAHSDARTSVEKIMSIFDQ